jgi:hypothetical protein
MSTTVPIAAAVSRQCAGEKLGDSFPARPRTAGPMIGEPVHENPILWIGGALAGDHCIEKSGDRSSFATSVITAVILPNRTHTGALLS